MKMKSFLSITVFSICLFFAQGGWLPSDVRLDTGDTAGWNSSRYPKICSSGDNVYVVWPDDRNGQNDIYFNYSTDGGTTWQASDVRLDTDTPPGAEGSYDPQICCSGNNVYVIWQDYRNGMPDIYFNYSTNNGASWQSSDIRVDTGDTGGTSDSFYPQICCNGSNVYAVWEDWRNGFNDIYFNYSTNGGASWQSSDTRLDTGDAAGASGSALPQICCSGNNVYVVWEDARDGLSDIYFNYSWDGGVNWQASDIRLDTGDTAGAKSSGPPQICCSGNNVYVAWHDERNPNSDIYFNHSADGGAHWQVSDTRIDTGDNIGANSSWDVRLCCNNSHVYAVWWDSRNGSTDIYFNYSTNGGANWLASSIRLDTGDTAGAKNSGRPEICCSGSNVYVAWEDYRNGWADIYFNHSVDGGATWQATDTRLDTGDTAGSKDSTWPVISCSDYNAYVAWEDDRNGARDIYFNVLTRPDIHLKFTNKNIADGSTLNGGTIKLSKFVGKDFSFRIENLGSANLDLTGSPDMVTLSGPAAPYFMVSQQPLVSTIAPGGFTTFKLRTKKTTVPPVPDGWQKSILFTVTIPNSDDDENPYNFDIQFTAIK